VSTDIGPAAALYTAGDYQSTCAACQAVLQDNPRHFDALHLLGVALSRLNRHDHARVWLRAAAAEQPDHAQLQTNLCNAHLMLKDYAAALTAAGDAVRLAPNDVAAWNNLGLAHKGLGQTDAAIKAFRHAITLRWDNAQACFNLATVLGKAGRLDEALDAARTAQRVAPLDTPLARMADISNEIGRGLMALGRYRQALAECRRFLRRHPDDARARWNLSLILLLLGEYADGWRAYESRWGVAGHDRMPDGATVLDPGRVCGRHVLILTEQGRGDMLQFVRYAPLLHRLGARVSLQVYPDLLDLLAAMPGVQSVVSTASAAPEADLRTPVMSLPLAFGSTLDSVPATVPYLRVPPDRLARWRDRLGTTACRRIGLVCSGSPQSLERSAMPAAELAPLLALPNLEFHCLQPALLEADETWLRQSRPDLHRYELADFADTAALVTLMDLVITVDTATAHLAGGLGRPVWIMLPFNPDFRWLTDRTDSPWYPTARLFRQPAPGQWAHVVRAVIHAL
jgi:tetratricopeptide (TPR) repeat protein